ncbi:MAG: cytochrome b5 [Cytophagales bacterium]|nr:cytochrome b5 [Cytophagales bacterium]
MKTYSQDQFALRNGLEMEEIRCGHKGKPDDPARFGVRKYGANDKFRAGQDSICVFREAPQKTNVF